MELQFTKGAYGRPRVGLPPMRLVNAYVESTTGGPQADARLTRPGLTRVYDLGDLSDKSSTVRAMFQQPGLFNGDLFTIVNNTLFRNNLSIGTLAYGVAPQMAAADNFLAIVSGGALYVYNGNTLTEITLFSDGVTLLPTFSSVAVLYSIFVYTVAGSDQFYFSNPGEPSTIQLLNYSAAQTAPDQIVQVKVLAEQLYFFGQTSTEKWNYVGTNAAPFQLSQGQTYARGCASQNSVCLLDNSLFWIGEDLTIYRSGGVPQRVSTSYIEDRLRAASGSIAQTNCCTFNAEGHVYYVVNLVGIGESYAYDVQTGEWARWGTIVPGSDEPGVWLGGYAAGYGASIMIGSYKDGRIFQLDPNNKTDDGQNIQVIVSAAAYITEGRVKNSSVVLQGVRGVGTEACPTPKVLMRYSDDGGREWSSWLTGNLGEIGKYRYKTVWRALGLVEPPGRIFEFSVSDPVNVAFEGLAANQTRT